MKTLKERGLAYNAGIEPPMPYKQFLTILADLSSKLDYHIQIYKIHFENEELRLIEQRERDKDNIIIQFPKKITQR